MIYNIQYKICFLLLLCGFLKGWSQKKEENIGTEVINVVKPYTPSVSDAFKVKEIPMLIDEETSKKETIEYTIFSFPVASTFTPSKGMAANVDKEKEKKGFKNYFSLGLGNYSTINADLFITENISSTEYISGNLRHLSSQGGIKQVVLDDKYFTTVLDLSYGNQEQKRTWNVDLGYKNQIYNWYGLPENTPITLLDEINPQHTFHDLYIGGKIKIRDSYFNEASLRFNRFWDAQGSAENRLYIKPSFQLDVMNEMIKTDFIVDYVGGTFERDFSGLNTIKYGFSNFGVHPSIVVNKENWTLDLGGAIFYSLDTENAKNKLFVYPKIHASLKVVGDLMLFYAGADGNLEQNSYRDFVNTNPFVSPTLYVVPTDKQYDLYIGLKGKLANTISYNLRGSYINEKNKVLFNLNSYSQSSGNEDYAFGNSFGIVYDDLKTMRFFGELNTDFSKNVSFGINGTFSAYTTTFQEEAWNLPAIKLGANLEMRITEKWNAGANLFFVGERMDKQQEITSTTTLSEIQTLSSYFDLNLRLGYKYNNRLDGFLKLNNVANQAYEKWLNYPVQGFQLVLGASYKFDF
jgi:hypothetical protein